LPSVLAVDNGENGHHNAERYAYDREYEIEFCVVHLFKGPKRLAPVAQTSDGVVGENMGYEAKSTIGKIVAMKLL
jgi:hypothetical protein